jgi:hypothetical protein
MDVNKLSKDLLKEEVEVVEKWLEKLLPSQHNTT